MTTALRCRLFRGVYSLVLADGEPWEGLVGAARYWHPDWRPIAHDEPTEPIDALVECRIDRLSVSRGAVMVAVPAHARTEYVFVKPDAIVQRPQETVDEAGMVGDR